MNNDNIPKPIHVQLAECKAALEKAMKDNEALARVRDRYQRELRDYQREYEAAMAGRRAARKERDKCLKDLMKMQDQLAVLERRANPVPGGWNGNNGRLMADDAEEVAPAIWPQAGGVRGADPFADARQRAADVVRQVQARQLPGFHQLIAQPVDEDRLERARVEMAEAKAAYQVAYREAVETFQNDADRERQRVTREAFIAADRRHRDAADAYDKLAEQNEQYLRQQRNVRAQLDAPAPAFWGEGPAAQQFDPPEADDPDVEDY